MGMAVGGLKGLAKVSPAGALLSRTGEGKKLMKSPLGRVGGMAAAKMSPLGMLAKK